MSTKEKSQIKRTLKAYPLNYALLQATFPLRETNLYPWGDTLYNPSGVEIPDDIMVHEEVHVTQQGDNPELWWNRYIIDKDFRLEQELEAYGTQLNWVKERYTNQAQKECLFEMAQNLISLYNFHMNHNKAESLIRNKAKKLSN